MTLILINDTSNYARIDAWRRLGWKARFNRMVCLLITWAENIRWMSEKMDGVRAYWNGEKLLSKMNKEIICPPWFTNGLPKDIPLDGELWMGRNKTFMDVLATIRKHTDPSGWNSISYVLFDLPGSTEPYEARINYLRSLTQTFPPHVSVIEHQICTGNESLLHSLHDLVLNRGEGFMLMKPGSMYLPGRTQYLLKVKVLEIHFLSVMMCSCKTRIMYG